MSRQQRNNIDPNAKRVLEQKEQLEMLDPESLPEGEYVICPKCNEKMPKTISTCVTCGARLKEKSYTPISDEKAAKIRWIVGAIMIALFFVFWFVFMD